MRSTDTRDQDTKHTDNVIWLYPTAEGATPTEVERALRHLRDAVPALGVALDTVARLGVIYDGGETGLFVNLDDGADSFGIAVPAPTLQRLALSDGDYGLAEAASETLTHFLGIARRDMTRA